MRKLKQKIEDLFADIAFAEAGEYKTFGVHSKKRKRTKLKKLPSTLRRQYRIW